MEALYSSYSVPDIFSSMSWCRVFSFGGGHRGVQVPRPKRSFATISDAAARIFALCGKPSLTSSRLSDDAAWRRLASACHGVEAVARRPT